MTTRSDIFTVNSFTVEGLSIQIRNVQNSYAERYAQLDPRAPDIQSQIADLRQKQNAELTPLNSEYKAAYAEIQTLKAQGNLSPVETEAYNRAAVKMEYSVNALAAGKSNSDSAVQRLSAKIPVKVEETGASSVVVSNAEVKQAEASEAAARASSEVRYQKNTANSPTLEKEAASAQLQGMNASPLAQKVLDANIAGSEAQPIWAGSVEVKGKRGDKHKVFLREKNPANIVYFEVLPEIVEQHTTEYEAVQPVQFPGAFQKYKGSATTQWTVNATFISRTSAEATQNYRYLQMLRGWTKPFFGLRSGESFPGKLGAPPPVLQFGGLRELISTVPVVITSLNWNWPKDVDYIATDIPSAVDKNFIPFPVVMQVPIQLLESYSIDQFNSFSLADYRAGRLDEAFTMPDAEEPSNTQAAGDEEMDFGGYV